MTLQELEHQLVMAHRRGNHGDFERLSAQFDEAKRQEIKQQQQQQATDIIPVEKETQCLDSH